MLQLPTNPLHTWRPTAQDLIIRLVCLGAVEHVELLQGIDMAYALHLECRLTA